MKTRKVLASTFLTRKDYDALLTEASGFMNNVWTLLRRDWDTNGVTVSTTKKEHTQHISTLNRFLRVVREGK